MSTIFLKVKVKSLAEEARIIRREERRARDPDLKLELATHRRNTVRREARHSLLALGYLRGRAYRAMERTCHQGPGWEEVERMVRRYGPPRHNTSFEEWRKSEQTESIRRPAA